MYSRLSIVHLAILYTPGHLLHIWLSLIYLAISCTFGFPSYTWPSLAHLANPCVSRPPLTLKKKMHINVAMVDKIPNYLSQNMSLNVLPHPNMSKCPEMILCGCGDIKLQEPSNVWLGVSPLAFERAGRGGRWCSPG